MIPEKLQTFRNRIMRPNRSLKAVAELIDRGELKTCIGAVLALADARDAHLMLEGRLKPPFQFAPHR
jgi:NADPH:quinone reductase-like Zn-dependent oxidoreductase